jgi:5-methylcytosine-specific restriction endonuclease McrA
MRKIAPWAGKTDDDKIPLQVQLRVLLRQGGKCALTGHKFAPGDEKRLDHKIPLADGGPHAETNLQWILDTEHKAKTRAEAAVRARLRGLAAKHMGIREKRRMGREKKQKPALEVAAGKPRIAREYGL